jgi:hypothetical protein
VFELGILAIFYLDLLDAADYTVGAMELSSMDLWKMRRNSLLTHV